MMPSIVVLEMIFRSTLENSQKNGILAHKNVSISIVLWHDKLYTQDPDLKYIKTVYKTNASYTNW